MKSDIASREDIKLLLDTFYSQIMTDEVIGYFFTEVVPINMETHMPRLYDFWETTLFHKALYKGNPILPHIDIHRKSPMNKAHFDRWVEVFLKTIDDLFEGEVAELAKQRAQSMATVMQIKIYAG